MTTGARPTLKCNIVNSIIKPESRTCPYFSDCYHLVGRVFLLHYHNNLLHFSISQSLLGSEHEELHYRYNLTVLHGKSEYTYKGPVISMIKNATDIKNEGRCLVIREKVWDYMSYKLKITKHWNTSLYIKIRHTYSKKGENQIAIHSVINVGRVVSKYWRNQ